MSYRMELNNNNEKRIIPNSFLNLPYIPNLLAILPREIFAIAVEYLNLSEQGRLCLVSKHFQNNEVLQISKKKNLQKKLGEEIAKITSCIATHLPNQKPISEKTTQLIIQKLTDIELATQIQTKQKLGRVITSKLIEGLNGANANTIGKVETALKALPIKHLQEALTGPKGALVEELRIRQTRKEFQGDRRAIQMLLKEDRIEEAIAIAKTTVDSTLSSYLCTHLLKKGLYEEAIEATLSISNPESICFEFSEICTALTKAYKTTKEPKLFETLIKACEACPQKHFKATLIINAYNSLIESLFLDEAIKMAEMLHSKDSLYINIFRLLIAQEQFDEKKFGKAEQLIDKISNDHTREQQLCTLGNAFAKHQKWDKAIEITCKIKDESFVVRDGQLSKIALLMAADVCPVSEIIKVTALISFSITKNHTHCQLINILREKGLVADAEEILELLPPEEKALMSY